MFEEIGFIDIEATSYCNARCPFCNRTDMEGFKPKHLDFEVIRKLPFERIKHVLLLGNKGDAIFYPDLFKLLEYMWAFDGNWVTIHTNASAHDEIWWTELAEILNGKGDIVYALDGLEDTHSLHRVGTKFEKVVSNVKAFNDAGGAAICQFIKFDNNAHQEDAVRALAKEIGTKGFWVRKSRGFNETLKRPDGAQTRHELNRDNIQEKVKCVHLDKPSLVLTVDGEIRPCCFMADDDYVKNFKIHFREDIKFPQHIINYRRDPKSINLKYRSFDDIMNSRYYMWIKKNYKYLYRCNQKCKVGFTDIVDGESLNDEC